MEIGQRAGGENGQFGRGCASGSGGRAGGMADTSRTGLFWKGFVNT